MPSTQISAETPTVNKTNAVSAPTELGVQGISRKDKCQTNNRIIMEEGRGELSTRSYWSETEKIIYTKNNHFFCPPKIHNETLIPQGMCLEVENWEVIRFTWGYESGPPSSDQCLYKKRKRPELTFSSAWWGYSEKVTVYRTGRGPSPSQTCQHLDLELLSLQVYCF